MAMSLDSIWGMVKARPFQPFVMTLADGRAIRVVHPECIWTAPDEPLFFVTQSQDKAVAVDPGEVVGLLPLSRDRSPGAPRTP